MGGPARRAVCARQGTLATPVPDLPGDPPVAGERGSVVGSVDGRQSPGAGGVHRGRMGGPRTESDPVPRPLAVLLNRAASAWRALDPATLPHRGRRPGDVQLLRSEERR